MEFQTQVNKAIFEELTIHGKNKNVAIISGEVIKAHRINGICGRKVAGTIVNMRAKRRSGVYDEIIAVVEDTAEMAKQPELEEGKRICIYGRILTMKSYHTKHVLLFILASIIETLDKPAPQNEIALYGKVVYQPKLRETPKGRRVADMCIEAENPLTGKKSYIPAVCWQSMAVEAAEYPKGQQVQLLGRLQSREYTKTFFSTGEETKIEKQETHKARELSISYIEPIT